jgi:hypothetical protein
VLTFLIGSLHFPHLYIASPPYSDTWDIVFLAAGVYADAANFALQCLHSQMPELSLFTEAWWHTGHSWRSFWFCSMFFTLLRTTTPYLAPNLPELPAFTVLLVISLTR